MSTKVAVRGLIFAACALLGACSTTPSAVKPFFGPPHPVHRIVTLMPSFADEVCAMDKGSSLVGVSQYSRSASCAHNVPEVANFASVDSEKIIGLHPDVVLAIPAQQPLVAPLRRAGVRIVFMPDDALADIFGDIHSIGVLTGDTKSAGNLVHQLQRRTAALQASEHFRRHPRVFVVLQAQPIWTVGPHSYISTLVEMAGGRNAVRDLPRAYAQYSAEALLRLQPDAIVAGSDAHLESLLGREPWRSLRAVRENHVFILSDPAMLERPGPDYNEGLSWLIEHLRPLTT